ncbi:hypothetical protein ACFYVL_04235 [Streptomyces sp. NPDC004111]|uniref:hypothetical protein n=1 Tax=Streptomyces sp. NPDC004111 TaxID=3364690 RepID=UPI003691D1C5
MSGFPVSPASPGAPVPPPVSVFRTEHEFTLPKGYLDDEGTLHRTGVMRLATAADEILPLREASVQRNPAYLTVIVLSRVITRLGDVGLITPPLIERLFASDVAYLQDLYNRLNGDGDAGADGSPDGAVVAVSCPHCRHEFEVVRPLLDKS